MSDRPRSDNGIPDGSDPVELAHWLFDRARNGEAERLGAYVDAGAPVDLTDPGGNTLLMLASYHGHARTVQILLDRKATVDAVNDRGQTPLSGAVFKGYVDVVELLLAAGGDPDAGTPSPMDTATFFGRVDLYDLLRAHRP
ncbi:MAG: ankyrin repeat domain-containing protein [Propionibacteriaceae bacterium]